MPYELEPRYRNQLFFNTSNRRFVQVEQGDDDTDADTVTLHNLNHRVKHKALSESNPPTIDESLLGVGETHSAETFVDEVSHQLYPISDAAVRDPIDRLKQLLEKTDHPDKLSDTDRADYEYCREQLEKRDIERLLFANF